MKTRRPLRERQLSADTAHLRPISYYFSRKLYDLRRRKWLHQRELAEVVGIPQTTLSDYESGWANPNLAHLIKLCEFFDVSLESLVLPEDSPLRSYAEKDKAP